LPGAPTRFDPANKQTNPTGPDGRIDPSTKGYFRGLDYKTAIGPLQWASDLAAQLWFSECKAMTACKADMAADGVDLSKMKIWTKRAADKILAYLQIAPGGRNLLCPPRATFGFFYQTFIRPHPMDSYYRSFPNWWDSLGLCFALLCFVPNFRRAGRCACLNACAHARAHGRACTRALLH
jgi:hypothetical protein